MNEIQHWLSSNQDYDDGLLLANKYIRNRSLLRHLNRHRDQRKMVYELSKVQVRGAIVRKAETDPEPELAVRTQGKRLIVYDDHIHEDDLPENMKPLYRQNRELYKQMRALHEKMKLVKTDLEREQIRATISEYDDIISQNWDTLDNWDGSISTEVAEPEISVEDRERMVATARKFVNVSMRKLKGMDGLPRQQMVFKIEQRLAFLKNYDAKIGESVKLGLKKEGIDC
jgi:hypothetical protein